jgi:hypothetical protein
MDNADEFFAEADFCRQLAADADPTRRRILLELAELYEAEGKLILGYPSDHPWPPAGRSVH